PRREAVGAVWGPESQDSVALLATHVHDLLAIGAFDRARRALEEARLLVRTDTERLTVLVMSAELASRTGHPNDALAELEQADLRPDPGLLDHALGVSSFDLGQPHRARRTFDRCSRTEVKDRHIVSTSNLAEVEEWLGHIRDSHRRLSDLVSDTSSSTRDLYLPLGALASRMVDLGHPTEALDPLMRSARLSRELRREDGRTSNAVTLARATLEIGRPARSLEIVEDAATSPGWKSARSHGLAIVRAEASWILSGPSAVLPVVRDERERQRGWDAPIPAAEL